MQTCRHDDVRTMLTTLPVPAPALGVPTPPRDCGRSAVRGVCCWAGGAGPTDGVRGAATPAAGGGVRVRMLSHRSAAASAAASGPGAYGGGRAWYDVEDEDDGVAPRLTAAGRAGVVVSLCGV